MGRAVVGRLALTDRIPGDLLPGHARREAARSRRRRSNSIDQASGRCTGRSRAPARGGSAGASLGAARLRHGCIPDGLAPPRIAALAGGLGPAVPGYAERCGLRPPVGATGAAPPTGALFPPSPSGRRTIPSATDSATSGRIRPGRPRRPSGSRHRGSDRPARCNRAATSLGSGGPRRAQTGRPPRAGIRSKPARGAGSRMNGLGTEPTPDSQRRGSNPRGGTPEARRLSALAPPIDVLGRRHQRRGGYPAATSRYESGPCVPATRAPTQATNCSSLISRAASCSMVSAMWS
jgi:hypothetical protein